MVVDLNSVGSIPEMGLALTTYILAIVDNIKAVPFFELFGCFFKKDML